MTKPATSVAVSLLSQLVLVTGTILLLISPLAYGFGNYTIPAFPTKSHNEGHNLGNLYQGSYYGGDDYDELFKKRPPRHGGAGALQNSFWMVPVLRYLMTVSGKEINLSDEPLTIWLPVVLEFAANWWFQEQQFEEELSQRGEILQGSPVPVNQLPANLAAKRDRPSENNREGASTSGKKRKATRKASPGDSKNQSSDDGGERKDEIKHLCESKSCPACNNGPCLCNECTEKLKPDGGPEIKARVWSGRTLNIVQTLAYRQVTGRFPLPTAQLLSSLSQDRLRRNNRVIQSKNITPSSPSDILACIHLIYIPNERVVVLRENERCEIWNLAHFDQPEAVLIHGITYATICAPEAVAFPDNRILIKIYQGDLISFTNHRTEWYQEVLASGESLKRWFTQFPHHFTFLVDGQVLFLANSSELWMMVKGINEWRFARLSDEKVSKFAVHNGRFLTFQEKHVPDIGRQSSIYIWSQKGGHWCQNLIYQGDIAQNSLIFSDTRFYIKIKASDFAFDELNGLWRSSFCAECKYNYPYGILPDGRGIILPDFLGDLEIYVENNGEWQTSDIVPDIFQVCRECGYHPNSLALGKSWFPRNIEMRLSLLLSDGRIATTTEGGNVQVWLEEDGEWIPTNLRSTTFQDVLKLIELPNFRLAALDNNGTIRIWNLMPTLSDSMTTECPVTYTAQEKREILSQHFQLLPEEHDGLSLPLALWEELLALVSDEEIHDEYPDWRIYGYQRDVREHP